MRILFLDDNPARVQAASNAVGIGNDFQSADTAMDCICLLCEDWDVLYLDHDLEGAAFADPAGDNTGSEVVRWMVRHKPKVGSVIIHTLNIAAGRAMERALKAAGYTAKYRSYLTLVQDWGLLQDSA